MKFSSNLEIHFSETGSLMVISLFIFILFSLAYSYFELKMQTSTIAYKQLLIDNLKFSVVLWLITHIGFFMSGWYREILGGEESTSTIFLIIGMIVLTFIKYQSFNAIGYICNYPKLMIGLPVIIIYSPIVLFLLYAFALGKGFQH